MIYRRLRIIKDNQLISGSCEVIIELTESAVGGPPTRWGDIPPLHPIQYNAHSKSNLNFAIL